MPRGKAYTKGQKEFIVTLRQAYDQERRDGDTVSTKDAANRVAKGLHVSLRTVKSVLAEYHRTGHVTAPSSHRGKPPFRILPPLETVIRHRIRELNRKGHYVSIPSVCEWLQKEHHIVLPDKTLWRTLKRTMTFHNTDQEVTSGEGRDLPEE